MNRSWLFVLSLLLVLLLGSSMVSASTTSGGSSYRSPVTWSAVIGVGLTNPQNATLSDDLRTGPDNPFNGTNYSGWTFTGGGIKYPGNTIYRIGIIVEGKMGGASGTNRFKVSLYNGTHWGCQNQTADISTSDVSTGFDNCNDDRLWGLTFPDDFNMSNLGVNVTCSSNTQTCSLDLVGMNFSFHIHKDTNISTNLTTKAVSQNETFVFNGTVTCIGDENANCGIINYYPRYNLSSNSPDTIVNTTQGETPFHALVADYNLSGMIQWSSKGGIPDNTVRGIAYSTDGLKLYITGQLTDQVLQYNGTIPFDVRNTTYSHNVSINDCGGSGVDGLRFDESTGLQFYIKDQARLCRYNLTTAWDVSTATLVQNTTVISQDSAQLGFDISYDGLHIVYAGDTNNKAYQYDLATAWNLSSLTNVANVSLLATVPSAVKWSRNGKALFVSDNGNDTLYVYTMVIPFNLSNATFSYNISTPLFNTTTPRDITFANDEEYFMLFDQGSADFIRVYYANIPGHPSQYCNATMDYGGSCTTTWTVNYTGAIGGNYTFDVYSNATNTSFNMSTNNTADVNIYNLTTGVIPPPTKNDTLISNVTGTSPFYTNGTNPKISLDEACLSNMLEGSSCIITFWVNATGVIDTHHKFYAYTNSTLLPTPVFTNNLTITITSGTSTCTYSGSENWAVTCSDACVIDSPVDLLGNNATFSGSGFVLLNANVFNFTKARIENGCTVRCTGSGCLKT